MYDLNQAKHLCIKKMHAWRKEKIRKYQSVLKTHFSKEDTHTQYFEMLQRIRIRTTRLSKLYNDADHNFYLSHSVSLWWSIMILCLLTDSALGSQRHLNSTSVTLSIPSDGIRHKVPNHHHHTYCHSIFSPFKLPPSAKWMPKVKLHQVDNKIILSPVIFQGWYG